METSNVTVRKGSDFDIPFALELSPVLAGVAVLPWHSSEVIEEFQTNYINKMLLNLLPLEKIILQGFYKCKGNLYHLIKKVSYNIFYIRDQIKTSR